MKKTFWKNDDVPVGFFEKRAADNERISKNWDAMCLFVEQSGYGHFDNIPPKEVVGFLSTLEY